MSKVKSILPVASTQSSEDTFSYKCPNWACRPPPSCGFYFDVMKNNTVISKLLLDDKLYFLIGRHSKQCHFILDHASVSRFHSVVLYHKHLDRIFLIDLGSTHGTFIGSVRLEPHKPQVIPIDTTIYFGQSTRCYTLRERKLEMYSMSSSLQNPSILHETGGELDDLTQYNTAINRQTLAATESEASQYSPFIRRVSVKRISFSSNPDEIINPEDVDPSVGRFRNMVQSSFVPTSKRIRLDLTTDPCSDFNTALTCVTSSEETAGLYSGLDQPAHSDGAIDSRGSMVISAAPKVDEPSTFLSSLLSPTAPTNPLHTEAVLNKNSKKIYAKEAWPGKKPSVEKSHNFLL